jgi:hypothetical protein
MFFVGFFKKYESTPNGVNAFKKSIFGKPIEIDSFLKDEGLGCIKTGPARKENVDEKDTLNYCMSEGHPLCFAEIFKYFLVRICQIDNCGDQNAVVAVSFDADAILEFANIIINSGVKVEIQLRTSGKV